MDDILQYRLSYLILHYREVEFGQKYVQKCNLRHSFNLQLKSSKYFKKYKAKNFVELTMIRLKLRYLIILLLSMLQTLASFSIIKLKMNSEQMKVSKAQGNKNLSIPVQNDLSGKAVGVMFPLKMSIYLMGYYVIEID